MEHAGVRMHARLVERPADRVAVPEQLIVGTPGQIRADDFMGLR
jgi:hypothetical protein